MQASGYQQNKKESFTDSMDIEVATDGDDEAADSTTPDPVISSGINFGIDFGDISTTNSSNTMEPSLVYWRLAGVGTGGEIGRDSRIVTTVVRQVPTLREGDLQTDQGATGSGVKRKSDEDNRECRHCNKELNTQNIDALRSYLASPNLTYL